MILWSSNFGWENPKWRLIKQIVSDIVEEDVLSDFVRVGKFDLSKSEMEIVTFKEIKQIVSDIVEWDVLSDIVFNDFVMSDQVHMHAYEETSKVTLGNMFEGLNKFCNAVMSAKSWVDMNEVTEFKFSERLVLRSFITVLINYHKAFTEMRYKPGGEGYEQARNHFEKNQN